jgi:hypothetical protein
MLSEAGDWLQKPGIANAFGLIVFTDRHVYIKKVLQDSDFWRGLDDLTGEKWPIFVLRRPSGEMGFPRMKAGEMGFMVPVWNESPKNSELLKLLSIASLEKPYLVVCSMVSATELLIHRIKLADPSQDVAYSALKDELAAVV